MTMALSHIVSGSWITPIVHNQPPGQAACVFRTGVVSKVPTICRTARRRTLSYECEPSTRMVPRAARANTVEASAPLELPTQPELPDIAQPSVPANGDAPGTSMHGGGMDDMDEKERLRRQRISEANVGKHPWNKGRKHSPGMHCCTNRCAD